MNKYLINLVLCIFFCYELSAQKHEKSTTKSNIENKLSVRPQENYPLIDLVNREGVVIKTLKAPPSQDDFGGSFGGFVSNDGNFVFLIGANGIYRIKIADNTMVSVPLGLFSEDGLDSLGRQCYTSKSARLLSIVRTNNEVYFAKERITRCYSDGEYFTKDVQITIYKVDFNKKECKKHLTISDGKSLGYSSHDSYVPIIDNNDFTVELYNIHTKNYVKKFVFDKFRNDVKFKNREISTYANIYSGDTLILVWQSPDFYSIGLDSSAWQNKIVYDLASNSVISESYVEGICSKVREVGKTDFPNSSGLVYFSNYIPEPFPHSDVLLNPFPDYDFYSKPKRREIRKWIEDYKIKKDSILELIVKYPDSMYTIHFFRKPSIFEFMKKDDRQFMESEYEWLIKKGESLNASNSDKRSSFVSYTTIFSKVDECPKELFRINQSVYMAKYIDDHIIECNSLNGKIRYDIELKKIIGYDDDKKSDKLLLGDDF